MENQIPKHVQVPNDVIKEKKLDPTDVLVYAHLKSHMNRETLEAYPSITLLAKEAGLSRPTVMKAIKHLEENKDILIRRVLKEKRCKSYYKFNVKSKNFEMYGVQFLEKPDITSKERMYLIVVQPYMFKDQEGIGKISYSNKELAELISIDRHVISDIHKSLEAKNIISISKTDMKDNETGLDKQLIIYNLVQYHQEFIYIKQKIKEHDLEIISLKEELKKRDEEIKDLRKTVNIILRDKNRLIKVEQENQLYLQLLKQNGIDTNLSIEVC
jgi:DNA-binding MarR family transcriptional regulator